jgi:hypothetical protein
MRCARAEYGIACAASTMAIHIQNGKVTPSPGYFASPCFYMKSMPITKNRFEQQIFRQSHTLAIAIPFFFGPVTLLWS